MLIICQIHIHPAGKEEEGEQVQKDATSIKQRSLWLKVLRICRDLIVIFSSKSLAGKDATVDHFVTMDVCLWHERRLPKASGGVLSTSEV